MDRNLRIRMLLEAGDRVSRPLRDIAGGSTRAAQALKAARDRLGEIDQAQKKIDGFRELKTGLRSSEAAMNAARLKATQLGRAIGETDAPTKKMIADFTRAKREAAALTTEHEQQTRQLQQLRASLNAAGIATGDLAAQERRLRQEAGRTTEDIERQERAVTRAADRSRRMAAGRERFGRVQGMAGNMAAGGAAAVGTGIAASAPIIGSIRSAMDYESVMTDIAQKAGLGREEARKMGLGLLAAAKAANQLPEALQEGVDTLAGFGLDPRQATKMMQPIGRAATAYKAEIADLSAAAFAANDNLKVPVAQTAKVIDIMAQAGKAGAFEIKDMAGQFPALTAAYQALGQKGTRAVADLAAGAQIARKGAGDSASAGNNLLNLLNKISTKEANDNFKKFGVDLPASLKKAARDGKGPIEAIAELTDKALKGDRSKLSYLFGDAQVQAALRPLLQNLGEFRKIRDEAMGASGTTDRDFAERMNDSGEKAKKFQVAAKALGITLGAALLPTATTLLTKVTDLADKFNVFATRFPNATHWIALGAGGAALLMIAFGALAVVVSGLLAPFAALSFVAGALNLSLFAVLGIAAGVVLGIAAIGAAAYLIYNNWGAISAWFSTMWLSVKASFMVAVAWVTGLAGRFRTMGGQLIDGLIGGITGRLSALKNTIVNAASAAANWFKSKLGIHSPSRVFAGFGGFMMEGLSNGIDDGAGAPVRRIGALSREIAAAMAIGTATPALAIGGAGGASASGTAAPAPAGGSSYVIHVHAAPGMDERLLADLVDRKLREAEASKAAAARSSFADVPDTI